MSRSFLSQLQRDSYRISRASGDLSALQRGGVPMLARRLVRRSFTRRFFAALNQNGTKR